MFEQNWGNDRERELRVAMAAEAAKRSYLLEAGELQEPDIAGAEAIELITDRSRQRMPLTKEDLGGRALRLTQRELEAIVSSNDRFRWLRSDWRESFLATGEVFVDATGILAEYSILFPDEVGHQAEYERAMFFDQTWAGLNKIVLAGSRDQSSIDEVKSRQHRQYLLETWEL